MMSFTISTAVLRRVLWLDAVGGWGMALMHFLLADALAAWTGVPATWVQLAGELVLVPACMAAWLATRVQPPAGGVRLLAGCNAAWVLASLWVAFGAGLALTSLGLAWVLLQAAVVLVLAELEWFGARAQLRLAAA
jgi:hypothetical protein